MKEYLFIGGSHGIGQSTIQQLLVREPESIVHLACREQGAWSSEARVKWQSIDVSDGTSLPNLAAINFVNFAGYVYFPGSINLRPFTSLTVESFRQDLELNLIGNVRILQNLVRPAKASKFQPSFVFFSSVAVRRGMPMHASVASAKAAVEGLAISLAAEYAPKFRFNIVAPSLTDTPLTQSLVSRDSVRKISEEKHPLRRLGEASDVASTTLFLLSDESAWMTGQVLRPDGGMSL